MPPKKTWKSVERRVARSFGAERQVGSGSLGRWDRTQSDSTHPSLYLEVKYRENHAAWTLWEDTSAKAKKEEKTPVVILAKKSRKGFLLCLHVDDIFAVCKALMRGERLGEELEDGEGES